MSRLDSFIRRMQAQRTCLNWAAAEITDLPGPVLELGLGNGRTYDHLCELLPDRDIYVFDRRIAAHPPSIPPQNRMFLGDIAETLPEAVARFGRSVALVHTDLGTGDHEANSALAAIVAPLLAELVAPGGIVVANFSHNVTGWNTLPELEGVRPGRYYLYRSD
jgi:hypothetical protein